MEDSVVTHQQLASHTAKCRINGEQHSTVQIQNEEIIEQSTAGTYICNCSFLPPHISFHFIIVVSLGTSLNPYQGCLPPRPKEKNLNSVLPSQARKYQCLFLIGQASLNFCIMSHYFQINISSEICLKVNNMF